MATSSTSCQRAPAPTRAVRLGTSTAQCFIAEVCTRIVSGPTPIAPWPVAWTVTVNPCAAANLTVPATSSGEVASTTAAGVTAAATFHGMQRS